MRHQYRSRLNYGSIESKSLPSPHVTFRREQVVMWLILSSLLILWGRFFYLQIIKGESYNLINRQQLVSSQGKRGRIYSADGYLLAGNHYTYKVYLNVAKLQDPAATYQQLATIIEGDKQASASLKPLATFLDNVTAVKEKLSGRGNLIIANNVSQETLSALQQTGIKALETERILKRFYPEKTMAAQVLGFLSQDKQEGHYGIEGGRNKELSAAATTSWREVDRLGKPLSLNTQTTNLDGRDLYLTIRRDLQTLAEDTLIADLAKFGASRGEIIIMDPHSGKILALATTPNYDPANYAAYDSSLYKNPAIVDLYEPGSTFKVLVMAAAIDAGVVNPQTVCPKCGHAREVAGHFIKTWNNVYNPNITMTQALEKSDNTAMVFVADKLGVKKFQDYLRKFGIGEALNLEVEEELVSNFPQVWGPVETATRSFGQGVSITSLQLMRAVGAIANGGKLMRPFLIEKSTDHTGEILYTQPEVIREVISSQSAQVMREMMQKAAAHGEAQYIYKNTNLIAGKTGTAQIPTAGGYSQETIASFIGFAPYTNPKFLMMVKFEKPQSSIYAAETAALTWKKLAEKLFIIFNIETSLEPK